MDESPASSSRSSGVLLHVSSLPGPNGIGDLGPAAHAFVDWLAAAKQTWWQMLPLGPPAAGNSPYQCYSAFAGNPDLISPEWLVREGLLSRSQLAGNHFSPQRVDYRRMRPAKAKLTSLAWKRFSDGAAKPLGRAFQRFREAESDWLDDFALFMALRERFPDMAWTQWPKELARRNPAALRDAREEFHDAIERHQFIQFLFFRQLDALRAYARERGVKMIGDIPIFVSADSSDVWANPHLFQLDRDGSPKAVAGVPPDYFSKTGQRWGNPLYDWNAMRKEGYAWWIRRVRATLRQADLIRLDHFRGFAAYWRIPAENPTAEHGHWVNAPGRELFETTKKKLGGLPFIAEDLGLITPDVESLRDDFGLPGMRVLQFAFGHGDSPFLPHRYIHNTVVYTGTHDNDTTAGWFKSLSRKQQQAVVRYTPDAGKNVAWALIRLAWSSVAKSAIAPLQDLLALGSDARMNTPGQAEGNWTWRAPGSAFNRELRDRVAELTQTYGREPRPLQPPLRHPRGSSRKIGKF